MCKSIILLLSILLYILLLFAIVLLLLHIIIILAILLVLDDRLVDDRVCDGWRGSERERQRRTLGIDDLPADEGRTIYLPSSGCQAALRRGAANATCRL